MNTTANIKEAALKYSKAGLAVLPVWACGPKPKTPACRHGKDDATTDPAKINAWFCKTDASIGVGIRMGTIADDAPKQLAGKYIIAVDEDTHDAAHNGIEWHNGYISGDVDGKQHTLPDTLTQTTWSGGRQLLYFVDKEYRNTSNGELGIDVRCGGGYIVGPPTEITHDDGRTGSYTWVDGEFDPSRIAEADDEVYRFLDYVYKRVPKFELDGPADVTGSARAYVKPSHVPVGGRHTAIVSFAAHLQAQGYPDDEITAKVTEFNEEICEEPVGNAELGKIVDWVLEKPKGSVIAAYVDDAEKTDETITRIREFAKNAAKDAKVFTKTEKGETEYHVDRAVQMMLNRLHACTIGGVPAIWCSTKYLFGPNAIKYMAEAALPTLSAAAQASLLKKLNARLYLENQFSAPSPELVRFDNGLLNVKSGEFTPVSEESWLERIPNPIPHDYDPDAPQVSDVDAYLDRLSDGHRDIRRNLLQSAFLAMTRYRKQEQAAVFIGDGGNGKSKWVEVLQHLAGDENVSILSLARMANRFEIGGLAAKTVNFSNDMSAEYLSGGGASSWKQITGGDTLRADVKNSDGFSFSPYCLEVIVCNEFPRIEGGIDKATARRLFVIPFTHSFRDKEGDYTADADGDVVTKICRPETIAYLIRLTMEEGMRMVREPEFRFSPNYANTSAVEKLALDNSSVLQWIEHLGLDTAAFHMQRRQTMYDHYAEWCKRAGLKAVSMPRFRDEVFRWLPDLKEGSPRVGVAHIYDFENLIIEDTSIQIAAFVAPAIRETETAATTNTTSEKQPLYIEVSGRVYQQNGRTRGGSDGNRYHDKVNEVKMGVFKTKDADMKQVSVSTLASDCRAWYEHFLD